MDSRLRSHPRPCGDYPSALARMQEFIQSQTSAMNPQGKLRFLDHGSRTDRVMILVHGYCNGPQQFADLGQVFFDQGYNVLIAPLPHHGLADRMNRDQSFLTAGELARYSDQVVDIACGLGTRVCMMGLSAGGVCTAWAAQNRPELDMAVIISPAFGYQRIPARLTRLVMGISLLMPDNFEWWNPALKLATPPDYAYPRYSKHALMQILRLGFSVQHGAARHRAAAQRLVLVLNDHDDAVSRERICIMARLWKRRGTPVEEFVFPESLQLGHDLIDPHQPDQRTDLVYPVLSGFTLPGAYQNPGLGRSGSLPDRG